jgi:hypothetical protein
MSANNKKGYCHQSNGTPMTRRDLLGAGLLSSSVAVALPSFLTMVSRKAYGQELNCSSDSGGATMVPFLIVDLAGGSNIAGTNAIVGGKGGQEDFLPAGSYETVGLAAAKEPGRVTLDKSLGIAFHPDSKMLQGIKEVASATTQAGVDGALFCTASGDDTRNNPHNPLYWIAKAGLGGELVSLVGSDGGQSGGRAAVPAASVDPSKTPSRISRPADALGLVDPGKLATLLSSADVNKIMNATRTMSESRLKMFEAKDMPSKIQDLMKCGYINSGEYLSKFTPAALNPATDTQFTTAPAVFPGIANNAEQQSAGTIAKLVLDGMAGAGVVSMGGYDYHGQGRAQQDSKDLEAGRMIGRFLEAAARKNKPVMVYVFTDGGVSARAAGDVNGIFPFVSDSGQRSAALAFVYKPGGARPEIRDGQRQIGSYSAAGAVDTAASIIGGSVENLSKCIVANYLALHGKEGDLAKVVGDNPFGADLGKYLAFNKVV